MMTPQRRHQTGNGVFITVAVICSKMVSVIFGLISITYFSKRALKTNAVAINQIFSRKSDFLLRTCLIIWYLQNTTGSAGVN